MKLKKEKAEPKGYAGTQFSMSVPMSRTHPFPTLPRVPEELLRKPLPNDAPPAAYWREETNDVGTRFHALVIPLPVHYHPLDPRPDKAAVADALEALASQLRG